MMNTSDRPVKRQVRLLRTRLDIEVRRCTSLTIGSCDSSGVARVGIEGVTPAASDTVGRRRDRKVEVLQSIAERQLLPVEVGIDAGYVRFTNAELLPDEDRAWIGKASSILDLSSGYLSFDENVLQVVPDEYRVNVYCCVPNVSAVQRLAASSPGWDESLKVVDNLRTWWKSTRQYRCPWNSKNLRRSVAVIVQLSPISSSVSSPEKTAVMECGDQSFALKWRFRSVVECPELVEPCDWEGVNVDWEEPATVAHSPRKKQPEQSRMSSSGNSHPMYPVLFADETLQTFRDALLARVQAAQEGGLVDAEKVVPRITSDTLKEFDDLSEDVSISSRFMLALACVQIECGYLEKWVATDALNCFPAAESDFRMRYAATSQKKAIRELRLLQEEIEEFSG